MNMNERILKKSKSIQTVDSSEISSDTSDINSDKFLPDINKNIFTHNNNTIQSNTGEFNPPRAIKPKRSRFYSENIERNNLYENITYNKSHVKKINHCLKTIAKNDLVNSNVRKFSY